jgi:hypothetical protein
MQRTRSIVSAFALAVLFSTPAFKLISDPLAFEVRVPDQETQRDPVSLAGSARLIETKQESEKVFKQDIVGRGLCAVTLILTNKTNDVTYSLERSNMVVRTEFDAQLAALEPQRAYDRLMWKIGGGAPIAEYGIARAIGEGNRKKKLKKSVLAAAIGPTITLAPGEEIEGELFFDFPKGTKTLQFSTLILGEIVNQKTGERIPMRLPLTAKP